MFLEASGLNQNKTPVRSHVIRRISISISIIIASQELSG
jgi:hypothetical protein